MKYSILIFVALFSISASSQVKKDSELHKKLAINDSLLFTEGLNKCNPKLMENYIHTDFEFYHDKGGISKGKDQFINNLEQHCAVNGLGNKRYLVKGSYMEQYNMVHISLERQHLNLLTYGYLKTKNGN